MIAVHEIVIASVTRGISLCKSRLLALAGGASGRWISFNIVYCLVPYLLVNLHTVGVELNESRIEE